MVTTRAGERLKIADGLRPTAMRVAVPTTEPGAVVKLTVEFTAPTTPGTFLSYWKSVYADGTQCFPKAQGLSVKVRVSTMATGAFEAM